MLGVSEKDVQKHEKERWRKWKKNRVSRFTETEQLIKVDDMPLPQLIIDMCQAYQMTGQN